METIDEAAFNYVDLKLTETKDRKCLPSNFFAADVEQAFKAGALWMAKQHAGEISECTEKSFKSGAEYMKTQCIERLSDVLNLDQTYLKELLTEEDNDC